jgi:putative ABC transport system permease protein
MERLWKDIRFALRTFTKSPAFAITAVVSLALGIGVNTTIFTIINTLFLNPLPVERVSEIVAVYTIDKNNTSQLGNVLQVSYPNYKDFRDRNSSFSSMAAYSFPIAGSVSTGGEGEPIFVELVTGNYFATLGVRPLLGRLVGTEDDRVPGASPVMVLGHRMWQRQFGGKRDVLGQTVMVNGTVFTVVGVAPEGFRGVNSLFGPDAWAPVMMYRELLPSQFRSWVDERRALAFNVAARLKPGVTIEQAGAEMVALAKSLETEYPAPNQGRTTTLRPLTTATIFPGVREALVLGGAVLMVIVGLVLLIACSNVANLLLARATARTQEIAVRLALGANRSRLVRQLMTENVLLSLIGGALGVLVAVWSLRVIWSTRPSLAPQNFVEPRLDATVLAFTLGISVVTGVVFGLAPAIQSSRASVVGALKDNTRSAGRRRRTFGLGNLLIVGQVALSLVALITAALFLRSSQAASHIDPGFDGEHVAVMTVTPGQQGYEQARGEQFYRDVLTAVRAVPGVTAASWGTNLPLFGFVQRSLFVEGRESLPPVLTTTIDVDAGYFDTTSIALLRGRDFREADRTGPPVAIVNDTMARRYWPNSDAVGKRFRFYVEQEYREVVGVVKTVKYATLGEDPQPAAYRPLQQAYSDTAVLYVRAARDPAAIIEPVRRVIHQHDPRIPVQNAQVVKDVISQSLWAVNLAAGLLGVFGLLALVLACVGLYGVMSYSVGQRTREIGLRMALGAGRGDVLGLVLRQGLTLVGAGVVLGVAGALAASRLVRTLLFQSPSDPLSFIGASGALIAVAVLASLVPARRASRVDPVITLRDG